MAHFPARRGTSLRTPRCACVGCAMPIQPYLQGQAFDPDSIRIMSVAFENACKQLGILDKHDAVTKIVARTVIDMAQRGFRDEESLTDAVMQEFRPASTSSRPPSP
jgi:hypothetical protein